ncbi:RNA-binding protein 7 [Drosophila innubila]|uniref:RNA-binding protein 7 n=1 Tax=Drosophila innubila TaxID=198719 RepID=UPI00148CB80D|nr:RNA-binding protein 7 [Drosophila innubila]
MDNYLAAFQEQQQQMCNAALMNVYANLATTHAMNFSGGGYIGYGPQVGPLMQPFNGAENDDDDCEDDDEDEEQSRTLFCSNLDERVTEEILYEVFLQAGPIESARIPLDNTGRQRNFGFVTYQHKSAVPYAVELYQGLELFQKKLTIRQQCPDKPKKSPASQSRIHNPFSIDLAPTAMPLNARHSMHDSKQFDRNSGVQNKYNSNNDVRRRSDSAVIDRKRARPHQQQQHNNSGGNRRSDQRYNHGRRRLL